MPDTLVLARGTADARSDIELLEALLRHPPDALVLARDTGDARGEVDRLESQPGSLRDLWRPIHGEVMEFTDGEERLPRFDVLEDFRPPHGRSCQALDRPPQAAPAEGLEEWRLGYERVMVAAFRADGTAVTAWTYACPPTARSLHPLLDADAWP